MLILRGVGLDNQKAFTASLFAGFFIYRLMKTVFHQLKTKKSLCYAQRLFVNLVGTRGFEPPTSSTPCWRDTRLRYVPNYIPVKGWQIYNFLQKLQPALIYP